MADSSNGWNFKRGLDEDFMEKLESLAKEGGWFTDVLADPDLILGIRNNYMNVYWRGQSLFKIERNGKTGPLKFSTHPKYLIDPDLSKAVVFDGKAFQVGGHKALTTEYGSETLGRMKRAAKLYTGDEKKGVHAIIHANPNIIDTEVTFNSGAEEEDEPLTPRIDLAFLEEENGEILLSFWEAKLYTNDEIRAEGDVEAPVIGQVRGYRKLVEIHREEIVKSYRTVAGNLVEIAGWVAPPRTVGKLLESVASGKDFTIDNPPMVGLIIYGYDGAQKGSKRWKTDMTKLERETLMPVCIAGDPKIIKLCSRRVLT